MNVKNDGRRCICTPSRRTQRHRIPFATNALTKQNSCSCTLTLLTKPVHFAKFANPQLIPMRLRHVAPCYHHSRPGISATRQSRKNREQITGCTSLCNGISAARKAFVTSSVIFLAGKIKVCFVRIKNVSVSP